MEKMPQRRTERLHLGRVSAAGAIYFVTFVTEDRQPWLGAPETARTMLSVIRTWHEEGDGGVLAATVMPDHVHVLFTLGAGLDVGQCVARWKASGRRAAGYAGTWQRDFWERRVRNEESVEDYGLYVWLNPYRAGLVPAAEAWPGSWMPEAGQFRFADKLGPRGEPPVEWLGWPEERFATLQTGE